MIAAPLFHATGFAHLALALGLGSTSVLHRRFDPRSTLEALEAHRCTALVVVPVMLQRMLALGDDVVRGYDTSALRIIFCAGSALSGDLAVRAMDTFGDVLYNLYGSTEVAQATIATPDELRAAPGTAGTPPRGTVVRLYDEDGRPIDEPGRAGRIFVANVMQFEGYSDGSTKDVIDGLMATGDVGHFDAAGRLFVDGRDDEMIVSGAENVFPQEVEEVLAEHPAVAEAACVGVPDEEFGQRLRAFVALRDGARAEEDELKHHVRENLARYKVPREVLFVDELPRNPTGKVLKRELAQR
jgi:fatty-acyl-CoA synthase